MATVEQGLTLLLKPSIALTSQEAIERFCDACWLEDGLAQNSLSAYRRDLLLLAQWLFKESGADLYGV